MAFDEKERRDAETTKSWTFFKPQYIGKEYRVAADAKVRVHEARLEYEGFSKNAEMSGFKQLHQFHTPNRTAMTASFYK
jgi:hypothetical protein